MFTPIKLSAEKVDPLWAKYFQSRSIEDRNALVVAYFGQVQVIAAKVLVNLRDGVNIDDLISSGSLGLIQAVETFDPARNVKFMTFSAPRIRGAILDGLREIDHASRTDRTMLKKFDRVVETFYAEHGRKPTDDELQSIMPMNAVQSAKLKQAFVVVPTPSSLTDQIHETRNGRSVKTSLRCCWLACRSN